MARRPTATARRDRAFAQLLIELDRILEMVEGPFNEDRPAVRPGITETFKRERADRVAHDRTPSDTKRELATPPDTTRLGTKWVPAPQANSPPNAVRQHPTIPGRRDLRRPQRIAAERPGSSPTPGQ
jgi:hypothetical protein